MNTNHTKNARVPVLYWLTILRFPAAVWVILIHSQNAARGLIGRDPLSESIMNSIIERGFLGVSFFFVLSGFILTWNYSTIKCKADYLVARATRILPVYYLALAFSFPLLIWHIVRQGLSLSTGIKSLMVIALIQSWIPEYSLWWNGPAWTLSCESFFYLSLIWILPVMRRLLSRCMISRTFVVLFSLWLLGLIAPLVFLQFFGIQINSFIPTGSDFASQLNAKLFIERFPVLRLIEFIGGVALCVGFRDLLNEKNPILSGILLLVGFAWVIASFKLPYILSMGTWCLPGFSCIILGSALLPCPKNMNLFFRSLVLLGNASYALYLFHYPILSYLLIVIRKFTNLNTQSSYLVVGIIFLATLSTSTAASILIFKHFEEPCRNFFKTYKSQKSPTEIF